MTEEAATAVDAAALVAESVGETLARARTALGMSVEDCAQQLKFAPRKLEALEQGRYDQLPAGTYARGMLRAYARLLNLDAEALVLRAADQVKFTDTTDSAVSLRRPIPFSEAGKRGNLVYVALSVVALVVVAWVAWGWQQDRGRTAKLSFVPAAQAPAHKQENAVLATVTPSISPIQQAPAVEPGSQVAPPQAAQLQPSGVPLAAGMKRLVLRFERESWVEIRGGNGRKLLVSQVHAPGSERVVEGEPPFVLVLGNAQHVKLTYDDQPVDLAPHVKVDVARLSLR